MESGCVFKTTRFFLLKETAQRHEYHELHVAQNILTFSATIFLHAFGKNGMIKATTMDKLPVPPASILGKIKYAERPAAVPRGYFDALMSPTRELLDRGLTIAQAADWWVAHRVIPPSHRPKFMDAMHGRLSRLRQRAARKGEVLRWRSSPYYESVHALGSGAKALCGAKTSRWVEAPSTSIKCARCQGVARRQGLSITEA